MQGEHLPASSVSASEDSTPREDPHREQQPLLGFSVTKSSYGGLTRKTRPARAPSVARRWVSVSSSEDSATGRQLEETTTIYWEVTRLDVRERPRTWSREQRAFLIATICVLGLLLLACGITLGASMKSSRLLVED
ncbi:hypothetical protein OQA88_10718 [Cercophora sp. LCS_1]